MLAGWQKVADCYGLRSYVFRAAAKIFAVTNKEQGFGELVTIIEPTPRPEEPARTASAPTGPIARRVRTARPPRAPNSSPELKSKRARAIGGDRNGNGQGSAAPSHQTSLPAYQPVSEPGQCLPGIWIHLGTWRDGRLARAQLLEPSHKSRRGVSVRPSRSAQVCAPLREADGG